MKAAQYRIMAYGEVISTITLPANSTQQDRNTIRQAASREHHIPSHYIRIRPATRQARIA